jgi:TolB-like protein/class 3 adenylate cyclase/Tfp pilus assembly protein PilF
VLARRSIYRKKWRVKGLHAMVQEQPVRTGRRLSAIVAADVAGYSRLMGLDEAGTARILREHRAITDAVVAKHGGRIVKTTGDGLLIEFSSIVNAVECAVAVQMVMAKRNEGVLQDRRMLFRIGINLGDILIDGDDILGDGVNVAARIENECEPGGVCLSGSAFEQVRGKTDFSFEDLGERALKNIARPVRLYAVRIAAHPASADFSSEASKGLPLLARAAIAVLPFTNMTGDPGQEYFSDGISEDIITALSKLRTFFVIARNSSFIYKGKSVHMKRVAEELGVGYVVEGSVRRAGDRVRITAQLNDTTTGSHLWAERYDRQLADVFAVQDEITQAVVAAIEPRLYAAENFRASRKPPDSMDAWELLMRALSHFWRVTREDNVVAQALLEKAVAIDPNYGRALGVLAVSHGFCAHMGWQDIATAAPIVQRAAVAAIAADSEDPWAHLGLGWVHLFARRFDESLAAFETALRLNPSFSMAHAHYGLTLCYCGQWEEGALAAERALRLSPGDPLSAVYSGVAGYAQFLGRNYEEAMRLARQSIRQRADFVGGHRVLAAAAGMAGRNDIAEAALRELRRIQPGISLAWIARDIPAKLDAEREHYLEGFRRAGLD